MTKTITLPSGEYLFLEVPEDSVAVELYDKESLPIAIIAYVKDPKGLFKPGIPMPIYPIPDGYELLGKGLVGEVTDGDATGIVESYNDEGLFCIDYSLGSPVFGILPLDSFTSLLAKYDIGTNYVMLKKMK